MTDLSLLTVVLTQLDCVLYQHNVDVYNANDQTVDTIFAKNHNAQYEVVFFDHSILQLLPILYHQMNIQL